MSEFITDNGILPGVKPVLEALETRPESVIQVFCRKGQYKNEIKKIVELCSLSHIPVKFVEPERLARMASSHGDSPVTHQGVVARLVEKEFCPLDKLLAEAPAAPLPLLLALDQVLDTGNLGALARTMYALGGSGIIVPTHNSALPGSAAMRASAGALRLLPLARVVNLAKALDFAEESGFYIYGTGCGANFPALNASGKKYPSCIDVFELSIDFPAIIVLGSENRGIRPAVAKRCQQFLHIPMARKFDSLNVAQTGAILIGLCAANLFNKKNL